MPENPNKKRAKSIANSVSIVVLHLVYKYQHVIFERDDGHIGPLSGKVNPGENYQCAAARELQEETGLIINPSIIIDAGHCFNGISPKGKNIFGISLFSVLENHCLNISKIKLNKELLDFQLAPTAVAIELIDRFGHHESAKGFKSVLKGYAAKSNLEI
jgi:8-oxo-dGTP pyrophosphatase MutT (NUDIX family)